jgi:kynurenine formamidase
MTAERMEAIDLSHTIEHGMITYKGLPRRSSAIT